MSFSGFPSGYSGAYGDFMNSGESIDEFNPRTLYVGNLEPSVSEQFLVSLFSQIGTVSKCKIIHETANDPYAFIEFGNHNAAVHALTAFNKRNLLGKEMRVNWATSPGAQAKVDTSKHFHVFIGDLSPEIDNKTLRDAFAPYGEISDVKVIRDLQTLKSKGYGFVSFVSREDAERAIEQMNGQWLGRRMIRTNWATRKPGLPGTVTFDDIMAQSSPNNMTVYVGGVGQGVTEEDLRRAFAKFGSIMEIRIFKQQGYAFVRFDSKESAAHAIMNITGAEISGSTVRCSWGKEGNNPSGNMANTMQSYGYAYPASGYGNYSTPPPPPPNPAYGWGQYFPAGPGYFPPNPGMYPAQQQNPWNYWPNQGPQPQ
uniref:RRM domain-containing protein n=1 Tax=Trichuris muris TaxID=70415 RepID=A0A5S6QLL2_TRIMR